MNESVIHLYPTHDPIGSYAGVKLDIPDKSDPLRPRASPQAPPTPVHELPRPTELPLEPSPPSGRRGFASKRVGSRLPRVPAKQPKSWATVGGQGQGIGCAVEVRARPELFRVVGRIDKGFETTGLEPWTYLLSPAASVLAFWGVFGRENSDTSGVAHATPCQQRLHYQHYSPRLLPIPPTHKLNGSSLGRPDVDLIGGSPHLAGFDIVLRRPHNPRRQPRLDA
eukprot:scaffold17384_cov48-Phaeocystis_antarctica.AAC.2